LIRLDDAGLLSIPGNERWSDRSRAGRVPVTLLTSIAEKLRNRDNLNVAERSKRM
jgi:hypothetical protein